jgi:GWxTD domain-containing protein
MTPRHPLAFALAMLWAGPTFAAGPPALDKNAERWLREVHLLMLPSEESLFKTLPSAEDRKEFRRIFWARRDPDPATPRNELEEAVTRAQARADELFALPGTKGSETECGQVFTLLGDPAEVQGAAPGELQGRGAREHFDSLRPMREGSRHPETWVYRSRPGDPVAFTGGELRIALDEACRFSEGGRVLEDLRRVAEARVARPDLAYRVNADGHLARLEDLLPSKPGTGNETLLEKGQRDFPLEIEPKLLLRTQAGQAYAAGLVQGKLKPEEGATTKLVGTVVTQAVPAAGPPSAVSERAFSTAARPDGTVLASYGLSLSPGRYTLRVALKLADGRASVATLPLEAPDFDAPGLKATGLVLYPDESASPSDPRDPFAALSMGALRLHPRFGNVFRPTDALQVVSVLCGGKADATTGKASLRARFSILKEGKPIAKGEDQILETAMAVASVGPLPLTGFLPGHYVVRLEATDASTGTAATQEASFEVSAE